MHLYNVGYKISPNASVGHLVVASTSEQASQCVLENDPRALAITYVERQRVLGDPWIAR